MRFAVLASGSSGNATVIEANGHSVLIDCGLSLKKLAARAAQIKFDLATLTGIAVTHEHSDHIGGVATLSKRYSIPVYMTHGTRNATEFSTSAQVELHEISPHDPFAIGSLTLRPSPVPHDAREPCQFVIEHEGSRIGVLTDLGSETPYIRQHYDGCDALVIEFNHDLTLLAQCEYPESVKSRIASRLGHFNNDQAEKLLRQLHGTNLRNVCAAHISRRANDIDLVRQRLGAVFDDSDVVWRVAEQDEPTPWISVGN